MRCNSAKQKLTITPDLKILLLAAFLLPLLIGLGLWQLERAEKKLVMQHDFQSLQQALPKDISLVDASHIQRHQPVFLQGNYRSEYSFLLDNKLHQGRYGFELITPFVLTNGTWVLVNRGWIAGDRSRQTLPVIESLPATETTLYGKVYIPHGEMLMLGNEQASEWPQVIQTIDMSWLQMRLQRQLFPYTVRLDEGSLGVEQRYWQVVNMTPSKHRAYAIQWFAMAAAVAVIVLLTNTNIVNWLKEK